MIKSWNIGPAEGWHSSGYTTAAFVLSEPELLIAYFPTGLTYEGNSHASMN
jgi:hypothetical protein